MSFVRETGGANCGAWVESFQRFTGNRPGDAWCASFVSVVLDVAYHGKSPLRRSALCEGLLGEARRKGLIVPLPLPDDLYFFLNAAGVAHHVGIVTGIGPLVGIAGNTSPDGSSANGDGVYEHRIARICTFVRFP